MPHAKSVWMDIKGDGAASRHVKMSQSTTQPRLWLATCSVTSGHLYCYGVKVSSLLGLATAKILEDGSRVVQKNAVHRDIFTSVEKRIVERIDGWKFFFEETISVIGTQEDTARDVQILFTEYFQLDHYLLRLSEQHELGRCATECASKIALNPFSAAFIIYYLSCIYDKVESMLYSYIKARDAERLLNTLKEWPLQRYLGSRFSRKVTEVMFCLVKICSKSSVWDSFVLWCYPSLSSTEVLSMFDPKGYYPTRALVSKLCSCIEQEDAEQILVAIISYETCLSAMSLSALCQVVKTFNQSHKKEHLKLLEKCRPYFVNHVKTQLDRLYTMPHLKELSDMAALIFSVDCASVSEVLPSFEQTLLKNLDRREDASQYMQQLEKIVTNPNVFRDKQQAEKLFNILATSFQKSYHGLLPRLLQLQKFLLLLDDESMLQLIDQWLGKIASVAPVLTSGSKSVCELRKYVFQVSHMPDDVPDDVKREIRKRCVKTFCDLALKSITKQPNVSHLQVLQELVQETKGDDIQPVEDFQSAIEDAITTIIQKASTCDLPNAEILVHLLLQEQLFLEADYSTNVLELMAVSRAQNIHQYAFLQVMTADKFWKIISAGECERIFDQWLSQAIHFYCVNKAKKRRSGTVDFYVLFLYEYLADLLALPLPSVKSDEAVGVRNQVEFTVKKEFVRFEPKNIIDMLDSAASEMKEDAVKLLEQHLQDAKIKNLMSEREYHSELDRFAESAFVDWKVKWRYCFKIIYYLHKLSLLYIVSNILVHEPDLKISGLSTKNLNRSSVHF